MKNKDYEYQHLIFCTITKYIGTDTIVEIPKTIDGREIDKLGVNSFSNSDDLFNQINAFYSQLPHSKLVAKRYIITEVTIPGSISSIGNGAFRNQQLTKVTLNEGLEHIGAAAFCECNELESIVLPSTLKTIDDYAFASCSKLKSVTFLNENVKLGKDVFIYSYSLNDINFSIWKFLSIQELLKAFYYKFENFSTLTTEEQKQIISFIKKKPTLKKGLLLSDNATVIQFLIDNKINVKLEDLIKYIEHHIEQNHTDITAILLEYKNKKYAKEEIDKFTENKELVEIGLELPTLKQLKQKWNVGKVDGGLRILAYKGSNTTETIPTGTADGDLILELGFSQTNDFEPIENLIIDAQINTIGERSFQSEYKLKTIKLPSSLKEIKYNAFDDCQNLIEIEIPDSVTTLSRSAFHKCTSLKKVVVPNITFTDLDCAIFSGCENLTDITLNENITFLPHAFLSYCKSLTTIKIPNSVTTISSRVFNDCDKLNTIILSENLEVIGEFCFENCVSLEKIIFPKSLKSIGVGCFSNCVNLKIVEFNSEVEIGNRAFSGCPKVKIKKLK